MNFETPKEFLRLLDQSFNRERKRETEIFTDDDFLSGRFGSCIDLNNLEELHATADRIEKETVADVGEDSLYSQGDSYVSQTIYERNKGTVQGTTIDLKRMLSAELDRYSRLSFEDTVRLFRLLEIAKDSLKKGNYDETSLWYGHKALNALCLNNFRLVKYVTNRRGFHDDNLEYFSAGYKGLTNAVTSFNYRHSNGKTPPMPMSFFSYAYKSIDWHIKRESQKSSGLKSSDFSLLLRIRKAERELQQIKQEQHIPDEELVKTLNDRTPTKLITLSDVRRVRYHIQTSIEKESQEFDDGDSPEDTLPDLTPSVPELVYTKLLREKIDRNIKLLNDEERDLLEQFFLGDHGGNVIDISEYAKETSQSPQKVKLKIHSVLRKLKHYLLVEAVLAEVTDADTRQIILECFGMEKENRMKKISKKDIDKREEIKTKAEDRYKQLEKMGIRMFDS